MNKQQFLYESYTDTPISDEVRARAAIGKAWSEAEHPRGKTTPDSTPGSFAPAEVLPPEPGTAQVPEGTLRVYHYTDDLDAVLKEGLMRSKAKGHTYGEPDLVWASAQQPGKHKDYVEFYVYPNELGIGGEHRQDKFTVEQVKQRESYGSDVTLLGDMPASRIISHHRSWHDSARYLESDPEQIKSALSGEYDRMLDWPGEGPAIQYIKQKYGTVAKVWLETVRATAADRPHG